MNHYLLIYDLADDYLARRGEFRGVHLNLAWDAHKRGELILGGALGEPVDSAILMFKGEVTLILQGFKQLPPLSAHYRR